MIASVSSHVQLAFASPRFLPKPDKLVGRVVVLDVAFAATIGSSVSYQQTTLPFINGLGSRLAAWVDHHDHERHQDWRNDDRFVLATKAQHGACPEMITAQIVARAGPIDTVCCHLDLDGLYSAAKWLLDGKEPYAGADDDARAVDTRIGVPSATALRIDHALRARFRDDQVRRAVVWYLVQGRRAGTYDDVIASAAAEFATRAAGTAALSQRFTIRGRCAIVDSSLHKGSFDKTDLLLAGQTKAAVAIVRDSGMLTIAAAFHSGWDFVRLFSLGGGMPTRVTIPESDLANVLRLIEQAPVPSPRSAADDESGDEPGV
jgi:hypothetical protein